MAKYRYRPEKRMEIDANKLLIVGIISLAIALAAFFINKQPESPMPVLTILSTAGYQQVVVDAVSVSGYGIVSLESECYQLVANVEYYQAESIRNGLDGIVPERPNAHDIAVDAFNNLGVEVLMVKINDVRNDTFYSRIVLRNGDRIAELDARPSDATAIAVRMGVPIYVSDSILEEYGDYKC